MVQTMINRHRGQDPERGEARVNGIRLAYSHWRGPARPRFPPTVVLHGLLQSSEGMANLAAHLARGGPVLVPDLRGRGESDQPVTGYDPATMAEDVAALIVDRHLDRPVVIGRVHGGLIAYHLAARHPDLVRGVVLGDTSPEVDERRAARTMVHALPSHFASLEEAQTFYEEGLRVSAARARHDIPHDLVSDNAGGYHWRHNLEIIERIETASMPRSDWEVVKGIRCPALLLRGQRGEVAPEVAQRFRDLVEQCRVQTILGARHDVFLGPGAEQALGAIDLFLLRLAGDMVVTTEGERESEQLVLPGAEAAPAAAADQTGSGIVERLVRALNGRDDAALVSMFAPDGRIVQYRPSGKVREGGLDAARSAFWDVFADLPGAAIAAHDVITSGDRVACVLTVRDDAAGAATTDPPPDLAILAPIFLRCQEEKIVEFASYGLRLRSDQL